jgi:hypothetical protein
MDLTEKMEHEKISELSWEIHSARVEGERKKKSNIEKVAVGIVLIIGKTRLISICCDFETK